MRRLRRSKIVATLGPASSDPEVIAGLFDAGAVATRRQPSRLTDSPELDVPQAIE